MINLRSDTFTEPCPNMIKAMSTAKIGDDCYEEDPTVKKLEKKCSELLQKESALFMPSGTMSNQVAIKTHTKPGDEVLTHERYHVYYYESAPSSAFSGVHFGLITSKDGSVKSRDIKDFIERKPRGNLYAVPSLLCLENTVCSMGGKVLPLGELVTTIKEAQRQGMNVHLDGARIFNASAAEGSSVSDFAKHSNSISICFSKGLGAPMGSILAGDREFINNAKRYRKWFGGGLHQSGFIAAACLYALNHHTDFKQLQRDHNHAKYVYKVLSSYFGKELLTYNRSNMLLLSCKKLEIEVVDLVESLKRVGILVLPWDKDSIRMVFHRGVHEKDVPKIGKLIIQCIESLLPNNSISRNLFRIISFSGQS